MEIDFDDPEKNPYRAPKQPAKSEIIKDGQLQYVLPVLKFVLEREIPVSEGRLGRSVSFYPGNERPGIGTPLEWITGKEDVITVEMDHKDTHAIAALKRFGRLRTQSPERQMLSDVKKNALQPPPLTAELNVRLLRLHDDVKRAIATVRQETIHLQQAMRQSNPARIDNTPAYILTALEQIEGTFDALKNVTDPSHQQQPMPELHAANMDYGKKLQMVHPLRSNELLETMDKVYIHVATPESVKTMWEDTKQRVRASTADIDQAIHHLLFNEMQSVLANDKARRR